MIAALYLVGTPGLWALILGALADVLALIALKIAKNRSQGIAVTRKTLYHNDRRQG